MSTSQASTKFVALSGSIPCRASRVPAEFLRLDRELGRIAPGFRADLVLLDAHLSVRRTWIQGEGVSR
jgi:N-acetylglucosamine-6-phosphate deacetylase